MFVVDIHRQRFFFDILMGEGQGKEKTKREGRERGEEEKKKKLKHKRERNFFRLAFFLLVRGGIAKEKKDAMVTHYHYCKERGESQRNVLCRLCS
jgi:hypothetical protein